MTRVQFGLRLYLLVIALLATCCAWRGAVVSRQQSERAMVRMQYESKLASEERWRQTVIESMQRAPTDPQAMPWPNGLDHLKLVDANITAIRQELESLKKRTSRTGWPP
jgi:hypothetical protein